MARSRGNLRHRGFTLVELMVVVVILSVLAAIAIIGYRKYIGKARKAEAMAVIAEMISKEQTYRLEFGGYLPLRAGTTMPTLPSADESATAYYPISPTASGFESVRTATDIGDSTAWPVAWRAVGLRPRETRLYCTYLANAGNGLTSGGDPIPATYGQYIFGANAVVAIPWFYVIGACNLDGASGMPGEDTVMVGSSLSPTIGLYNDGK